MNYLATHFELTEMLAASPGVPPAALSKLAQLFDLHCLGDKSTMKNIDRTAYDKLTSDLERAIREHMISRQETSAARKLEDECANKVETIKTALVELIFSGRA